MSGLYALTLAVAAFLLFWIQLLFARMVLPSLGGTPAVWNTCLLFFQATLLAGYGSVHLVSRWIGTRRHALLHAGLLMLPWLFLPVAVAAGWPEEPPQRLPILWLLGLLGASVGLPFFVVSTTAPLLQRWFAQVREDDPYWLYASSNLGSFLALAAYPLLLEPRLPLAAQGKLWAIGYGLLATLTLACAVPTLRRRQLAPATPADARPSPGPWLALSMLPASLLYGVTTVITTDIATVPLLWCVPLAIYLGSFVLAFARRRLIPVALFERLVPFWLVAMVATHLLGLMHPTGLLIAIHLCGFGILCCLLHQRLADCRPPVVVLTRFYLWIAAGGLAGGAFNALAAPALFATVLEYPAMLLLSGLAIAAAGRGGMVWLGCAGMLGSLLLVGLQPRLLPGSLPGLALLLALLAGLGRTLGIGRLPAVATALLLALLAGFGLGPFSGTVLQERSFFGVHRVLRQQKRHLTVLMHGGTVHGRQSTDPARQGEPLSYYDRRGPAGQALAYWNRTDAVQRVAVLGLGAGTLAAYGQPGQRWDFYEIDPAVTRIARDSGHFTYLADCRAPYRIVSGDARLTLARMPPGSYDLIVLDAFSSDAVPVHLATVQAFRLYLSRLTPVGVLLLNISNRFLELEPLIASLARELGLYAVAWRQQEVSDQARRAGKSPSHWVVLARDGGDVGKLPGPWRPLNAAGLRAWTDDYSSLFSVLRLWR